MFKKVLVPLDGTELAEGILPYVSQLAKGLNIPLVLSSVIDRNSLEIPERLKEGESRLVDGGGTVGPIVLTRQTAGATEPLYLTQILENIEGEARDRLRKVANELAERDELQSDSVVAFGKPAQEIVRTAHNEGCNLIAMSTHGRNALGRGLLGSVTTKVVRTSHLPVLTITPDRAEKYWGDDMTLSRIMLPLDGSQLAETAIPYAEHIARKLSLEILLVRVVRKGGEYSGEGDVARLHDANLAVEENAMEYLQNLANRLSATGLRSSWKLLRGSPAKTIVELAQNTPQDLIVLTTHGRSGLNRWIRGSVAGALVRASGDPVLIIPPIEVQKSEEPENAWDSVLSQRPRRII